MRAGRGMLANVELSRPVGYGMHCVDRFGTKFLNARLSSYSLPASIPLATLRLS